MASIRNLKKFVIYQTNELLDDCRLTLMFNTTVNQEDILDIMIKGVDLRNDLFDMINNPADKSDKKALKAHYRTVINKVYTGCDELFEQLSKSFKS